MLLLHVVAHCRQGQTPVAAIHVNHQLQTNASETERFCQRLCEQLGVPLTVRRVSVDHGKRSDQVGGIEEAARNARYAVFDQVLQAGDLLMMAHHADDQAETVLFRMLRGSGVAGLAGMPVSRALGAGQLYRPWLAIERAELAEAAGQANLSWVEDPSNTDQDFDRNFLRHAVLPGLKARWPDLTKRLRHSASACADSAMLNARLAQHQMTEVVDAGQRLYVERLHALGPVEQVNLVRWWIRSQGFEAPALANWPKVLEELCGAGPDRTPEVRGQGFSLRRFQDRIYLVAERQELSGESVSLCAGRPVHWGGWRLELEPVANPDQGAPPIRVSTRQGGERFRPHPSGPSKTLKNWLQEQSVPPWERARLPLVFAGSGELEELIAVGDLWCSGRFSGSAPAAGWRLIVRRECD